MYTCMYVQLLGVISRSSDDELRFKEYLICRPEVDMDAKLNENVNFVRGTGKDFVLQFIKLTFIYIQIISVVLYMPYVWK